MKTGTSYFGNLFPTCQQVLGHACHIWYSLWLKSLTHNHSTRAGPVRNHCVMTGVFGRKWKGCASVPKHWGFFKWTFKRTANFDHWLKRITCCYVISLTWCRIMAVHKCCTFRLKRKNILSPTPDACCALLALRVFSSWLASRDLGTARSSYLAWVGPVVWPISQINPHHGPWNSLTVDVLSSLQGLVDWEVYPKHDGLWREDPSGMGATGC